MKPKTVDATIVRETIGRLSLGEPVVHKQMTMIPVLDQGGAAGPREYSTLAEALQAEVAEVGEVSESGSVPELRFQNAGQRPVLLIEGEELIGAKQNRILNVTILAPAKTSIPVPVSCVEAGRWGYRETGRWSDRTDAAPRRDPGASAARGRRFAASGRANLARSRRAAMEAVSMNMRRDPSSRLPFSRRADQGAIWDGIADRMERLDAPSESAAMNDLYVRHDESVEACIRAFPRQPGQVGAVFLVGRDFAGLDLFAHPDTFAIMFPKLVGSYALDAMAYPATEPAPSADAAQALLDQVVTADAKTYPAVGAGRDIRLGSPAVTGAALVADGRLLHLAAFARDDGSPARGRAGRHRAGAWERRIQRESEARPSPEGLVDFIPWEHFAERDLDTLARDRVGGREDEEDVEDEERRRERMRRMRELLARREDEREDEEA